MFRKMPFVLLGLILLIGGAHSWVPLHIQSILYGMSLSIKSVIIFFLPCIIFGLLFKAATGFARSASKTILTILVAIILSNFLSTMISFVLGNLTYQFPLTMPFPQEGSGLQPAFVLSLPKWIGNDVAMGAALFLGVVLGRFTPNWTSRALSWVDRITGILLKGLLYVVPLFLAGFFIKMCHDQVVGSIVENYALVFGLIAFFVFGYISLLYFIACRNTGISFVESIKNMIPAVIASFGSMSSAAAMPLTI